MAMCPVSGNVCEEPKTICVNEIYTTLNYSQLSVCKKCAWGHFVSLLAQDVPKKCNSCQTTEEEIIASGKLGCPLCVKSLGNQILVHLKVDGKPLIVQKAVNQRNHSLVSLTEQFQQELCDCLTDEKYEDAVVFRDKLKLIHKIQQEIISLSEQMTQAIEKEEYEIAKEFHLSILALTDETLKSVS